MKDLLNRLKDRIKTNFNKNKKVLLIFCIVWVVTIVATLSYYSGSLGKKSWGNDWSDGVIELTKDTVIEQKMSLENDSELDNFDSVCIKLATYARTNKGNITVTVVGNDSKVEYVNETFDVNTIEDNAFKVFKLSETLKSLKDKEIDIKVSSDSEEGSGAALYYSTTPELAGEFYINGELNSDYSLSTRLLTNQEDLSQFSKTVITWMCIGFAFLILLLLLVEPKLEVFFPTLIFIFGLVFMIVIIPLSPPDEQYHYECSLQISNKLLGQDATHAVVNKEYVNYSHFYGHYNISNGYVRFLRDFNEPLDLSSHSFTFSTDVDDIYSVYFVPQAIGITIARLLGVNMLRTFYAGRMTNLIFYCICVYFALKNAPTYKMLIGMIVSMPIFIQTAASMSYDCYVIALTLLILSFFLKWKFEDKKIKLLDYIVVLLCCLGMANAKYVYSVLTLLFFLVPKDRFGSLWKKILLCLLLCGASLYALLPILYEKIARIIHNLVAYNDLDLLVQNEIKTNTVISTSVETGFGSETYEKYGLSYMYQHPLETIGIFYRTIRYSIKTWFYNAIGRTLSGNTLVLPLSFAHLMLALLLLVAFREEEYVLSIPAKIVIILICSLVGIMMLAGFFITWTDQNQEVVSDFGGVMIQGIQGRYFSPLLPYFMTIFSNKKLKISKKFDKYFIFALILLTFEIVVYVLSYTFVN